MDPKTRKKSAEKYAASVSDVALMVGVLDQATIDYLIRCTEETAQIDGQRVIMPRDPNGPPPRAPQHAALCPQIDGHGDCECGAVMLSDGTNRPTEAMAIQATLNRPVRDPIQEAALEALAMIAELAGIGELLRRKVAVVVKAADAYRGREELLSNCKRCHKTVTGLGEDRLKSGYDAKCYKRWTREGRPDRHRFEESWTAEESVDTDNLVPSA